MKRKKPKLWKGWGCVLSASGMLCGASENRELVERWVRGYCRDYANARIARLARIVEVPYGKKA